MRAARAQRVTSQEEVTQVKRQHEENPAPKPDGEPKPDDEGGDGGSTE